MANGYTGSPNVVKQLNERVSPTKYTTIGSPRFQICCFITLVQGLLHCVTNRLHRFPESNVHL